MKKTIKSILKIPQIDLLRKFFVVQGWQFDSKVKDGNQKGKNFLIASNIGGNLNTLAFDITLAKALESRGHRVDFTICGGGFSGCMFSELNKFKNLEEFLEIGNSKLCKQCNAVGQKTLVDFGYNPITLHAGDTDSRNFNSSESGVSGAKRFLAVSNLRNNEITSEVVKRFCESSHLFKNEFQKILTVRKYDGIIAHHGIYVPQGDIVEVSKNFNIPIFTWVQGYRKSSYIFAKDDTYHKTLLTDQGWKRPLTQTESELISAYLNSRDTGQNDWIRFGVTTKEVQIENFFPNKGSGRTFLLLTNVSWDAQLHYDSNTFLNMFEWLESTIDFFIDNPTLNLIVRIHPAEVTGTIKTNEPVREWIENTFSVLPNNICIIEPEANVSTYSLMRQVDVGIIFASKSGLEMLAMGKPVVVAGEAWIKNKGICLEPQNRVEYFDLLKNLNMNIEKYPVNKEIVLRYAHYFFFRRTITCKSINAVKHYPYAKPCLTLNWEIEDPNLLKIVECIENNVTPQLD